MNPGTTPQDIIDTARSYLGVKWTHQGRSRDGLDCSGLLTLTLQAHGWQPRQPETALRTNYRHTPEGHAMMELAEVEGVRVSLEEAQIADVLIMQWAEELIPRHCGFVSYRDDEIMRFIHADGSPHLMRVVELRLDETWQQRVCGVFRLPSFANQ